jgi:hypothetical protein
MFLLLCSSCQVDSTHYDQSIKGDRTGAPGIDDNGIDIDFIDLRRRPDQCPKSGEDLSRSVDVKGW